MASNVQNRNCLVCFWFSSWCYYSVKYQFKIMNDNTGKESFSEDMSFKKTLKKIVVIDSKFNGSIFYKNKKGNNICHNIVNGKAVSHYLFGITV